MRHAIMPETSAASHVFVYGTLRRGESNDINRLQPAPIYVGSGQIAARLFHLGRYPGIVLGGPTMVHGDVYRIEPALEPVLDGIEGIVPQWNGEYRKAYLQVEVSGQALHCLVYELCPGREQGMPLIGSGDWCKREAA